MATGARSFQKRNGLKGFPHSPQRGFTKPAKFLKHRLALINTDENTETLCACMAVVVK